MAKEQRKTNRVGKLITDTENLNSTEQPEKGKKDASRVYINMKSQLQKEEKRKLAYYIVDKYVENFFAVSIDAGTTQQQIIERLMGKRDFVSLLTNNMTAFRENSSQRVKESSNEFILTGGKFVALFDALHGIETQTSFNMFNPRVVIIGVSGLVAEKGFFCHGNDEVTIKKLLLNKESSRIIIPVDHSKIGRPDSYLFGEIKDFTSDDKIERIIVACPPSEKLTELDKKLDSFEAETRKFDENIEKLKSLGVEVDIVPNDLEMED